MDIEGWEVRDFCDMYIFPYRLKFYRLGENEGL